MSQMFEWSNYYTYLAITMWICLGFISYFLLRMLFNVICYYNSKNQLVEEICIAVENNDTVACAYYLQWYPQCVNTFSANGYTPFLVACANGNTQLVKMMLIRGADIGLKSKNDESPFYLAAFYYIKFLHVKNCTCIRELYYAGADINEPNSKGFTPLQMAAMFGHTSLVRWLLLNNADSRVVPDPYIIATMQGHQDTADVIWKLTRVFFIECKK